MRETESARPIYLRDGAVPVFGFLHEPPGPALADTGVLMVPPFGWDETCSYRSRRDWACDLALAGFPALRIDLPGTGDSAGSPRDPGQLASWTEAAAHGARTLRELTGVRRVAAIGIGLGGLVLCNAIHDGAAIDELVLWAAPARGRALVRELRAFASLEDSTLGAMADAELGPPPLPDGYVWAGGFLLSDETARDLDALDVSALALPHGRPARALMLDRDGVSVDKRLRAHLERCGARVTVASGKGYGAMMAQPHHSRPPLAVFAHVRAWLAEASSPREREAQRAPVAVHGRDEAVELVVQDCAIRESPLTIPHPDAQLFGILTEPLDAPRAPLVAVLLNAGAIRHVGPNRMWVEAARRWACRGVCTLRLDLEGIGDAEGSHQRLTDLAELYTQSLVDQVRAALDALELRGLPGRFVLGGLCSGAYWSFHAALRDERALAAFMLNPQAIFWDESLEARRALRRGVMRSSSWRRVLRGQVPMELVRERVRDLVLHAPVALPRRALARRAARRRGENELEQALDRLRDTGKALRFVFSGNEPLHEELELEGYLARLERWPNATVELIPGRIHTLRPLQSQQAAHEALDRALADMLLRTGHAPLDVSPAGG